MSFPQTIDTIPVFTANSTLILADHYNLHTDILSRVRSVQELLGTPPSVAEPTGTLRARLFAAENAITALTATVVASGAVPIGVILPYAGLTAPSADWCICDGRAHNSAQLQTLLNSPNAPDLRDKFLAGGNSTGQAYGAKVGGVSAVTLTSAQSGVQPHPHTATANPIDGTHTHSGNTGYMVGGEPHTHGATIHTGGAHQHQIKVLDGNSADGKDGQGLDSSPSQGWNNYSPNGETMGNDGAHGHAATIANGSVQHYHAFTTGNPNSSLAFTPTVSVNNATAKDATASHTNIPPYQAVTYIIKVR